MNLFNNLFVRQQMALCCVSKQFRLKAMNIHRPFGQLRLALVKRVIRPASVSLRSLLARPFAIAMATMLLILASVHSVLIKYEKIYGKCSCCHYDKVCFSLSIHIFYNLPQKHACM